MIRSYNEVSVGMYLRLNKAAEELDEQQRTISLVSILSGYSEGELLNMPYEKFERLTATAGFLLTQPKPVEVRKVYEVGEWRLVPTLRRKNITTAQYISFQELSAQGNENIVALLACFMIPEGKKFNEGYDIEDVIEAMNEHLSIVDANALYAFFLSMCHRSMRSTLNYLRAKIMLHTTKNEQERMAIQEALTKMEEFQHLMGSGGGLPSSIMYLKLPEILGA